MPIPGGFTIHSTEAVLLPGWIIPAVSDLEALHAISVGDCDCSSGGTGVQAFATLEDEEDDMARLLIHTSTSDYSGADWVLNNTSAPIPGPPVARLEYPLLRRTGLVVWDIVGKVFNLETPPSSGLGHAQVYEWELLVDGASLSPPVIFTWADNSIISVESLHFFHAELKICGSVLTETAPGSGIDPTYYDLEVRWVIRDLIGTTIIPAAMQIQSARPVIDGTVHRELSWSLRKQVATGGNRIDVQSWNCYQPEYTHPG